LVKRGPKQANSFSRSANALLKAISKTLADLLKGQRDTLNMKSHPWEGVIDPRIHIYTVDDGKWNGMAVATQTGIQARLFTQDGVASWYNSQPPVLAKTYAVPLMTYAELKFIIGEYNGYSESDQRCV